MTEKTDKTTPTTINLHKKSSVLEVAFTDGRTFKLPCEYLRVFSPSAEVRVARQPVHGKAGVNIDRIEQKGNYAIRLYFDDGHDTGIYSWDTLHRLGEEYDHNWAAYLQKLAEHGLNRGLPASTGEKSVRILYFMQLIHIAGQEIESVTLPASVSTVVDLLAWLRERGQKWKDNFTESQVQVTINKQFAEHTTPIAQGDEVAIVPRAQ